MNDTKIVSFKDGVASFYFTTKISDNREIRDDGCLYSNVVMGRTGTQEYLGFELGFNNKDKNKTFKVHRYEEDVFHKDTLKSGLGKPVTDEHPEEDVNIDNLDEYRKGVILKFEREDNNLVGMIKVEDKKLIKLISKNKKRELSLGYQCKLVKDEYGNYKQTEIIINHLAVVEQGRAGNAVILDSKNKTKEVTKLNILEKIFGNKKVTSLILDDGSKVGLDMNDNVEIETDKEETQNLKDDYTTTRKVEEETVYEDDYVVSKTTNSTVLKTEVVDKPPKEEEVKTDEFAKSGFSDTNKEVEKEKESEIMFTIKDALKELQEVEVLKGTEAYEIALKTLDSKCVELGIGSIIPKQTKEEDNESIFDTAGTKAKKVGDSVQETFKENNFITGIQNIYNQFSPRNLKKLDKTVIGQREIVYQLSDVDARDLIGGNK